MTKIKIEVDNSLTALAGDPFGQKIAQEQILPKLRSLEKNKNNSKIKVIIPNNIKNVSASFTQGIAKGLFDYIDGKNFFDIIEIVSNDRVKNKFYENLYG